jgi:hypothetical protein
MSIIRDKLNNQLFTDKKEGGAPYFTIAKKSDQEKLTWLQQEIELREKAHKPSFDVWKANLRAYLGAMKKPTTQSDINHPFGINSSRDLDLKSNILYENTENFVSRMTRVKPGVEVIPSNDENQDRVAAKLVKLLTKHLFYINDLDNSFQKQHRHRLIFGNAYQFIEWEESKGDLHPEYIKLRDSNNLDKFGFSKDKTVPIKTGDVDLGLVIPWNVLLELKDEYEKVNNLFKKELVHKEELIAEYPKLRNTIQTEIPTKVFNAKIGKEEINKSHIWKYTFYHKKTKNLPVGAKIVMIHGAILDQSDLPFNHGLLPLVRSTDIDVPGMLHGYSRYQQVMMLQKAHDNMSKRWLNNEYVLGMPKIVFPLNSINPKYLANGSRHIAYKGNVPPQLLVPNPTSNSLITFRETLRLDMGRAMGVHPVSSGEPPRGVSAGVALQFLNEQENERAIVDIAKHNRMVLEVAKMMVSVCGDNYKQEDGRTIRVFGKNNEYLIKHFDSANLHKDYDIRIENGTALPVSKPAQKALAIETLQYGADLLSPEEWKLVLDLGSGEKLHTMITASIQAADSENDDILDGNDTTEPKIWENQILHLRSHYRAIQNRRFKDKLSEKQQNKLKMHIKVHEKLAQEKAAINPKFASKLAQLEEFPMFWIHEPVPMGAEQQALMAQNGVGEIPAGESEPLPDEQQNNLRNRK